MDIYFSRATIDDRWSVRKSKLIFQKSNTSTTCRNTFSRISRRTIENSRRFASTRLYWNVNNDWNFCTKIPPRFHTYPKFLTAMLARRGAHLWRRGTSAGHRGDRSFLDFRERSMKICSEAQAILRMRNVANTLKANLITGWMIWSVRKTPRNKSPCVPRVETRGTPLDRPVKLDRRKS